MSEAAHIPVLVLLTRLGAVVVGDETGWMSSVLGRTLLGRVLVMSVEQFSRRGWRAGTVRSAKM